MAGLFGGSSPDLVKKWNLSSFISEDSPRIQNTTSNGGYKLVLMHGKKTIETSFRINYIPAVIEELFKVTV